MDGWTPAPVWRRFAAMAYDSLLMTGLLFVAAVPAVLLHGGAIDAGSPVVRWLFVLYLAAVVFLFHGWFWTHGGQTLGMAAWGVRIVTADNTRMSWRAAFIRWTTACLGLANMVSTGAPGRRAWHERWSGTYTVCRARSGRRPA